MVALPLNHESRTPSTLAVIQPNPSPSRAASPQQTPIPPRIPVQEAYLRELYRLSVDREVAADLIPRIAELDAITGVTMAVDDRVSDLYVFTAAIASHAVSAAREQRAVLEADNSPTAVAVRQKLDALTEAYVDQMLQLSADTSARIAGLVDGELPAIHQPSQAPINPSVPGTKKGSASPLRLLIRVIVILASLVYFKPVIAALLVWAVLSVIIRVVMHIFSSN